MRLRVLTPSEVVLEEDVVHVTAEDVTGSLGIRPGHASLVTPLVPGVVIARSEGGREKFVAVNGGVMMVVGDMVEVVSRHAVAGTDLAGLTDKVVAGFEKEHQEDKANRTAFEKLRMSFLRGVVEYDRATAS
jgi:F-type H+-transporting ATPase subunit epsilon